MIITIYLNREKTSVHVLKPSREFEQEARKDRSHIYDVVKTLAPRNFGFKVEVNH